MRILYITAGAAGMYCGSCLRDNTLAMELMAQGHDVLLLPLYTPTRTDEHNVSHDKVFFGGISVYLQQRSAFFRKTPWLLDRLWDATAALRLASRRSVTVAPQQLGELTVSMLRGSEGFQQKELLKMMHWLASQTPPDIVNLPNSLLIGLARPIREALHKPICCTLQGEDLFLRGLAERYRKTALELIRGQVQFVDAFLAVSEYHARFMAEYLQIPAHKMHVVPLGIHFDGCTPRDYPLPGLFKIGYFARITPEKGLHLLCEAYARLRTRDRLPKAVVEVAGYLAPEYRGYLQSIERQMRAQGLADEFHYHGVLDREQKIAFLQRLDVLSVPATYDEPKGLFLLEAMANGVPVVQPRRGAFEEIVDKTQGGLLVTPDDPESLGEGLLSLWKDPSFAAELGRRGSAGVRKHYGAPAMAQRTLEVYRATLAASHHS